MPAPRRRPPPRSRVVALSGEPRVLVVRTTDRFRPASETKFSEAISSGPMLPERLVSEDLATSGRPQRAAASAVFLFPGAVERRKLPTRRGVTPPSNGVASHASRITIAGAGDVSGRRARERSRRCAAGSAWRSGRAGHGRPARPLVAAIASRSPPRRARVPAPPSCTPGASTAKSDSDGFCRVRSEVDHPMAALESRLEVLLEVVAGMVRA